MGVEETEAESAANAVAPRVSLDTINKYVAAEYGFTLGEVLERLGMPHPSTLTNTVCFCVMIMNNGFVVVGKSAPISPANFKREMGMKFAREDCIRQLWPMMAFAHKAGADIGVEDATA